LVCGLQEALPPLTRDFVDGVDEDDLAATLGRLPCATDDDTGFHGRVVEEIGAEAEHALE
jgi:hypothetical protein